MSKPNATYALLILALLSLLAVPHAQVRAQSQQDWSLVRRGPYWVTYTNGTHYRWRTAVPWTYDFASGEYVPYVYAELEDCKIVRTGLVGAKVFPHSIQILDPNGTDVRVWREIWRVERYSNALGTWVPVISTLRILDDEIVVTNASGVFITHIYENLQGRLEITYAFRVGSPLKHYVRFEAKISGVYRVLQMWYGIKADTIESAKGMVSLASNGTEHEGIAFRFLHGGRLSVVEDQSSAYWERLSNGTLRPRSFGRFLGRIVLYLNNTEPDLWRTSFTFANWTLKSGESLVVDPDTYTVSPPIKDVYVYKASPDTNCNADGNGLSIACASPKYPDVIRRTYLEFDISPIGQAVVQKVILSLYVWGGTNYVLHPMDVYVERVIGSWSETGITWNNQPAVTTENRATLTALPQTNFWWNNSINPALVQDAINEGSSTVSLRIRYAEESGHEYYVVWNFWDREHDGYDPVLYIEYTPNTAPNAPTLNNPAASARFNPSASVTFTWTFSDPDGHTQGAYQFQLDDNSDFSSPIIDTGKVSSSSTSHTATLPSTVGKYYWRVRVWDSYGAVSAWSTARSVIVDRIKVTSLSASDTRVNVGDTVTLYIELRYEYDNALITSGSFTLNGISLSYDSSLKKWKCTDSSSTVTAKTYNSVSGSVGYVSTVNMAGLSVTVIWDKLTITLSASDDRLDVGSSATISWTIKRQYDGSSVTSFSITIKRDGSAWYSGSASSATDSFSTVGKHTYTCASVTDNTYGITKFDTNTVSVIWDKLTVTLSVSDGRVNVDDSVTISWSIKRQYDGSSVSSFSITIKRDGSAWYSGSASSKTDSSS
ncbi:MAG: hypothetical protein DRJ18_03395, partial [Candidatus Methanomethylicota archaeon]